MSNTRPINDVKTDLLKGIDNVQKRLDEQASIPRQVLDNLSEEKRKLWFEVNDRHNERLSNLSNIRRKVLNATELNKLENLPAILNFLNQIPAEIEADNKIIQTLNKSASTPPITKLPVVEEDDLEDREDEEADKKARKLRTENLKQIRNRSREAAENYGKLENAVERATKAVNASIQALENLPKPNSLETLLKYEPMLRDIQKKIDSQANALSENIEQNEITQKQANEVLESLKKLHDNAKAEYQAAKKEVANPKHDLLSMDASARADAASDDYERLSKLIAAQNSFIEGLKQSHSNNTKSFTEVNSKRKQYAELSNNLQKALKKAYATAKPEDLTAAINSTNDQINRLKRDEQKLWRQITDPANAGQTPSRPILDHLKAEHKSVQDELDLLQENLLLYRRKQMQVANREMAKLRKPYDEAKDKLQVIENKIVTSDDPSNPDPELIRQSKDARQDVAKVEAPLDAYKKYLASDDVTLQNIISAAKPYDTVVADDKQKFEEIHQNLDQRLSVLKELDTLTASASSIWFSRKAVLVGHYELDVAVMKEELTRYLSTLDHQPIPSGIFTQSNRDTDRANRCKALEALRYIEKIENNFAYMHNNEIRYGYHGTTTAEKFVSYDAAAEKARQHIKESSPNSKPPATITTDMSQIGARKVAARDEINLTGFGFDTTLPNDTIAKAYLIQREEPEAIITEAFMSDSARKKLDNLPRIKGKYDNGGWFKTSFSIPNQIILEKAEMLFACVFAKENPYKDRPTEVSLNGYESFPKELVEAFVYVCHKAGVNVIGNHKYVTDAYTNLKTHREEIMNLMQSRLMKTPSYEFSKTAVPVASGKTMNQMLEPIRSDARSPRPGSG